MPLLSKKKPEDPTRQRRPPEMRAARKIAVIRSRDENGAIMQRYVEAIEDAAHDGPLTQARINERMGQ